MSDPDLRVARRLRRLRLKRGVSLVQLARASDLSPRELVRVERNRSILGAGAIAKLARALDVAPEDITGDGFDSTAAFIASSAQQREVSRQLRKTVDDLLQTTQALFDELTDIRKNHDGK